MARNCLARCSGFGRFSSECHASGLRGEVVYRLYMANGEGSIDGNGADVSAQRFVIQKFPI